MDTIFQVQLKAIPNIDYEGIDERGSMRVIERWEEVDTLQEASKRCRHFIDSFDLGSGNWDGGRVVVVVEGGETIEAAHISYNGRLWTPGERGHVTSEIHGWDLFWCKCVLPSSENKEIHYQIIFHDDYECEVCDKHHYHCVNLGCNKIVQVG